MPTFPSQGGSKNTWGTELRDFFSPFFNLATGAFEKLFNNIDSVSKYASLSAAVTAIGSSKKTIIIDTTTTLAANTTIPSNISIEVKKGGSIVKASTYTLTINGPFSAGLYTVFVGFSEGDVKFGDGAVKEVYSEWWGAVGDGVTDDAPAFRGAVYTNNNVKLQKNRTYLFSSSATADRMITLYPNVSIIGQGVTSEIKIGDGALGVRNIFSIDPTVATDYDLGTITLKDFSCDMNGDNNVRSDAGQPARNNALARIFYFRHVVVSNIKATNAPGNQILWIYTPTLVETASTVKVENNYFYRVANDIPSNYNGDHSSAYVQAHYIYQINNRFEKTSLTTTETAMELHGIFTYCEGNAVLNYNRGAHFVADMSAAMQESVVSKNYMTTRLSAITYWTDLASSNDIESITIIDNVFSGYGGTSATGVDLQTHVAVGAVDSVYIHGNVFKDITFGSSYPPILIGNLVGYVSIDGNIFKDLNWAAIESSALNTLNIQGNTFSNCAKAGAGDAIISVLSACENVSIQNNNFQQTSYYSENTIWIAGLVDHGKVAGNNFNTWYNDWPIYFTGDGLSCVSFHVDIEVYLDASVVPDSDVYATKGSILKDLNSGSGYFRSTSDFGNAWSLSPDYAEGTWTPVLTFATPGDLSVAYSTQSGRYTKIGRKVTVEFQIVTSTFTHTTASGNLRITGMPFTSGHDTTGTILTSGWTLAAVSGLVCYGLGAVIQIYASRTAATTLPLTTVHYTTGSSVLIYGNLTFTT